MTITRRTGLTTIRHLAYQLCRLVAAFDPIIRRAYPNSTALHLALEAVSASCGVLVAEADATLTVGD